MEEDPEDRWEWVAKNLRPPNFSLEKHFEDRLEWMRKNLKSPNFSPEWRERRLESSQCLIDIPVCRHFIGFYKRAAAL